MKRLPFKQPAEEFTQIVDWNKNLVSGETITFAVSNPRLLRRLIAGTPDDSSQVVSSSLQSDGTSLLALRRGTHGNIYHIRSLASSNLNQILEEDLILPVWDMGDKEDYSDGF